MTEKTTYCTAAVVDVLTERLRQINEKGFTPEHDDALEDWELAEMASDITFCPLEYIDERGALVKAAALILAEIDRLDRAAMREQLE